MAKLFISFTGIMYALHNGRVTAEDLDSGLFVFGCTRDHALTPGASGEHVESIVEDAPDLHETLVTALEKAEQEDRVRWRTREQGNASFELVDEVLVANGYQPLKSPEEVFGEQARFGINYNYSNVERLSGELEVVSHG